MEQGASEVHDFPSLRTTATTWDVRSERRDWERSRTGRENQISCSFGSHSMETQSVSSVTGKRIPGGVKNEEVNEGKQSEALTAFELANEKRRVQRLKREKKKKKKRDEKIIAGETKDLKLTMNQLFDAAFTVAAHNNTPKPDFPLPTDMKVSSHMMVKCNEVKGVGWFATNDIPAGTTMLIEKPLAVVMDWEADAAADKLDGANETAADVESNPATGSLENGLLTLALLKRVKNEPKFFSKTLASLYPRSAEEVKALPPWRCQYPKIQAEINEFVESLGGKIKGLGRISLIVRYNAISMETSPELFCYPETTLHVLGGTALYHCPSFFNHSNLPNMLRWAVGDVMVFRTNKDVKKGEELCISYIEHIHLCEGPERSTSLLKMDFNVVDPTASIEDMTMKACAKITDKEKKKKKRMTMRRKGR